MNHTGHFIATVIGAIVVVAAFSFALANYKALGTLTGGVNKSVTSTEQAFAKGG